jgi:hypothetical protein
VEQGVASLSRWHSRGACRSQLQPRFLLSSLPSILSNHSRPSGSPAVLAPQSFAEFEQIPFLPIPNGRPSCSASRLRTDQTGSVPDGMTSWVRAIGCLDLRSDCPSAVRHFSRSQPAANRWLHRHLKVAAWMAWNWAADLRCWD